MNGSYSTVWSNSRTDQQGTTTYPPLAGKQACSELWLGRGERERHQVTSPSKKLWWGSQPVGGRVGGAQMPGLLSEWRHCRLPGLPRTGATPEPYNLLPSPFSLNSKPETRTGQNPEAENLDPNLNPRAENLDPNP